MEAALSFYKALKVYPSPGDLITIYDKTVPKPVLDILAEMVAFDGNVLTGNPFGAKDEPEVSGLRVVSAPRALGMRTKRCEYHLRFHENSGPFVDPSHRI
ncbi:MAG: hypothetical protein Q9174_004135 [Haloplaca sp. 1 TL-2023]